MPMTPRVKLMLVSFSVSLLINSYTVFANYYAVSENGTNGHLWASVLLVFPAIACLIFAPIFLVAAIFKKLRVNSITGFIVTCAFFIGAFVCIRVGDIVRDSAFHDLAERSNHLVSAIEDYRLSTGKPPDSLEALIPEYLVNIPKTGMGAYPDYEYYSGEDAQQYEENPWVLVIRTPSGGINWDIFMYLPLQNYPNSGYGGSLERMGSWAYVHE